MMNALEESIKHWQNNVAAKTLWQASVDSADCALCQAQAGCIGCPVKEATGQWECYGTPYYAARNALFRWKVGIGTRDEWRVAAQAELDFLKSLR